MPLTRRQREVAQLLRAGKSYDEIAEALRVGRATVNTHVEGLYRRLGIFSRTDLLDVPAKRIALP